MRNLSYSVILPLLPLILSLVSSSLVVPLKTMASTNTCLPYNPPQPSNHKVAVSGASVTARTTGTLHSNRSIQEGSKTGQFWRTRSSLLMTGSVKLTAIICRRLEDSCRNWYVKRPAQRPHLSWCPLNSFLYCLPRIRGQEAFFHVAGHALELAHGYRKRKCVLWNIGAR